MTMLMMLAMVLSYYPLPGFDVTILRLVQSIGSTKMLEVMTLVSLPGNFQAAVISLIAVSVLVLLSPIRQALIPLSFVLPADFLSLVLKKLVDRPRPSEVLVNVHQLLSDPGFPSSHVVHYTVFFGFLAFLFLKTNLLPKSLRLPSAGISLALVLLIPFSRMYLGAHWPTDVIGGYLLGGSILVAQIRIFQKLQVNRSVS